MTPRENIERLLTLIEEKGVQGWEDHGEELVRALMDNQALASEYNPVIERLAKKALSAYKELVTYHELVQETAAIHKYKR